MSYKPTTTYDSDASADADDEFERSVFTSPTLPNSFDSPTDSDPPSAEHTPTSFAHPRDIASPTGLITEWTTDHCADFVSSLGLEQYADMFVDEGITGDALVELGHADLQEMGIKSVGHRLTVLKNVYDIKVKQNVAIGPDHYIPLSAEAEAQDTAPTQDDISRIIRIIKDRDERIRTAEAELQAMKEDLNKISEENRKLREDVLPVVRMAKNHNQPLPTPLEDTIPDKGSGLSRKFSTKKLFLNSAPKNPSPTIREGRITDSSSLDPSAAAMAASSHLSASMRDGSATSPHAQPSPTSPAYSTAQGPNSGSSAQSRRGAPDRTPDPGDPPLSGGSLTNGGSSSASTTPQPSNASTTNGGSSSNGVEIFKSFRVSIEDPCHKVLPVALKKYNITADWRQYALYIVHGDQERCLGLNERPLILFKQLDKEGRKPMFMLRKHAQPMEGHTSTAGGGGINQGEVVGGGGERRRELPGGVL
ncbi:RA-domain-containing protein [Aulographum hederae CBS 113979]|uniref:RA-domain-containing protein n=1 Tax=Aulographum hederae CBS 113979 TaxID=1176131 RepID=A0A6G1GN84_9PEZI|nr:RA-domain-containing protein [Aulographum hederae CBS 113979]